MFHTAAADRMGLNVTDGKALGILDRLGPLTAGQLGAETGLAAASVTGLVDRLEKKGFVRRVRDVRDRRRVVIEPAAKRLAGVQPVFQSLQQSIGKLCSHYSDEELQAITDFLLRAADVLRDETAKIAAAE